MTARFRFHGGVGVVGSTKVELEQDGWRVLLDMGDDIPGREGLVRGPLRFTPGTELRTRLRLSEAPAIERLYRPEAVEGTGLEGGYDGRTALFITHAHLDHVGLLGWVDPAVPVYGSEETVHLVDALEAVGQAMPGGTTSMQPLPEGERIEVGPFVVERWRVDHDVPGASGYLVHTDAGVLAYPGDLRLHGRHPELTERFAERAHGAAALVMEGTTLSSDPRFTVRTESDVEAAFEAELRRTPGLVLLAAYPRDIERVTSFLEIAARCGRTIMWPPEMAAFLRAYGVDGIEDLDHAAVARDPARFVVQVEGNRFETLLDLPVGPGASFLHANGEPLGPFQPTWDMLQQWLQRLQVPFKIIGTSGHATPHDLHRVVELIAPDVLYPLHTVEPTRLLPPPGTRRVLAEYGRWYEVGTQPVTRRRATVCVDLDSTLCDTSHRHHMVLDGEERVNTDWVAYSLACADDARIEGTCRLVRMLAKHYRIVLLSSRDAQARALTEAWLAEHAIPYDELILGDGTVGLEQFKAEHVARLIERGETVELVIDDLRTLPETLDPLGIPVLTVRPPYGE